MKTLEIHIQENAKHYPIYIGTNILDSHFIAYCQTSRKKWIIITDSHLVDNLAHDLQNLLESKNIPCDQLHFPAGESYKTRETKQKLEDTLLKKNYGRDVALIALGGGVVTDLVGFLAATYCRGVPVMYIPTTLLAMVDASIGGKTGVNTATGKNLIGAFYQPVAVFMDLNLLKTLPPKEWSNGIVEIVKHGLIQDKSLFQLLQNNPEKMTDCAYLSHIIHESCKIKQQIIQQDERDLGIRQLLNFGHTIGHAIETLEDFHIGHGEAVAIGIIAEAYLSALSGFMDISIVEEITRTLRHYHLPLKTSAFNDLDLFKKAMILDKKSVSQTPRFVLLDDIGKTHQENEQHVFSVDSSILDTMLEWSQKCFS
jgi:3-dehydroquinate synthase